MQHGSLVETVVVYVFWFPYKLAKYCMEIDVGDGIRTELLPFLLVIFIFLKEIKHCSSKL